MEERTGHESNPCYRRCRRHGSPVGLHFESNPVRLPDGEIAGWRASPGNPYEP